MSLTKTILPIALLLPVGLLLIILHSPPEGAVSGTLRVEGNTDLEKVTFYVR